MHPMLNTAIKAARKAGSIIQRGARDLHARRNLDEADLTLGSHEEFAIREKGPQAVHQPAGGRVFQASPVRVVFVRSRSRG